MVRAQVSLLGRVLHVFWNLIGEASSQSFDEGSFPSGVESLLLEERELARCLKCFDSRSNFHF